MISLRLGRPIIAGATAWQCLTRHEQRPEPAAGVWQPERRGYVEGCSKTGPQLQPAINGVKEPRREHKARASAAAPEVPRAPPLLGQACEQIACKLEARLGAMHLQPSLANPGGPKGELRHNSDSPRCRRRQRAKHPLPQAGLPLYKSGR